MSDALENAKEHARAAESAHYEDSLRFAAIAQANAAIAQAEALDRIATALDALAGCVESNSVLIAIDAEGNEKWKNFAHIRVQ